MLKPETLRSPVAFLAADRAFRLAIAGLSGNLRLAQLLSQILDQSERTLHLGFKSRDFKPLIIEQQKQLLQACEKGDVPAIVKLARSQCLALKHQLIGALLGGAKLRDVNLQTSSDVCWPSVDRPQAPSTSTISPSATFWRMATAR